MELLDSVRWGELLGSVTHETSCLILAAMALLVTGFMALRLRLFETAQEGEVAVLPENEAELPFERTILQFRSIA